MSVLSVRPPSAGGVVSVEDAFINQTKDPRAFLADIYEGWKGVVQKDVSIIAGNELADPTSLEKAINYLKKHSELTNTRVYIKEKIAENCKDSDYQNVKVRRLLEKHGFLQAPLSTRITRENAMWLVTKATPAALGKMFPSRGMTGNYAIAIVATTVATFVNSYANSGSTSGESPLDTPNANNAGSALSSGTGSMPIGESVACMLAVAILAINFYREIQIVRKEMV